MIHLEHCLLFSLISCCAQSAPITHRTHVITCDYITHHNKSIFRSWTGNVSPTLTSRSSSLRLIFHPVRPPCAPHVDWTRVWVAVPPAAVSSFWLFLCRQGCKRDQAHLVLAGSWQRPLCMLNSVGCVTDSIWKLHKHLWNKRLLQGPLQTAGTTNARLYPPKT